MKSILSNTRRPDITFHRGGRIDIASHIARQLYIKKGDVIDIAVADNEYYLFVRTHCNIGRHEAACYPANARLKNSHSFRAHSARLCHEMLCITNGEKKVSLPCGELREFSFGRGIAVIIKNKLNV